ncbi:MAG: UDP-N-acetylglucosamine 1-carboxyvinyltransferase [Candidatus Andersenbacteria bacterium]|nr:UDP-N-acetylglucosamine 1-carboxyvinyltransferase [Candidatus Andersenbacteria bacterium]
MIVKIEGPAKLFGEIEVYGSKNASLPLLAATLLTEDEVVLRNMPRISDIDRVADIYASLGVQMRREGDVVTVHAQNVDEDHIAQDLVGQLRGSILLLGALLGRKRSVVLRRPGGDVIGARPIDAHLDAFTQLGAIVEDDGEMVRIDGKHMHAGNVVLREFSVTATENVLLVAATLPGTTTISIAATEPHVVALCELLEKMGAKIDGKGTHTIVVTGSEKLSGAEFTNIQDMLEAGFFILLAAATKSELTVKNVPLQDLLLFFKVCDEIGIKYAISGKDVTVHPAELKSFSVQALPYPGIATDLQAPFAVIACVAEGNSMIHDPMYEGRFKHIMELQKMGARAVVCDPHRVVVTGPTKLTGRRIPGLDIRSGATLVIAGLVATGETIIDQAEHIERGYADLVGRLQKLGAKITKAE